MYIKYYDDDERRFDKENINEAVTEIGNILTDSAKSTFGTYVKTETNNNKKYTKKKWFDDNCKAERKNFHRSKRTYIAYKNNENRTQMLDASRLYKKTIRKAVVNHKRYLKKEIRNMRQKSPNEYWKYVNSLKDKKQQNNVDETLFYIFFKDLNSDANVNDETPDVDFPDIEIVNNLDMDITLSEVNKAIKKLKSGKASGLDNITNEFIKHSSTVLSTLYVKLFNRILRSGIIPEVWLVGVIIPIYKNKGDSSQPENYRPITILSCLGKLFTAIINDRLTAYLDDNELLLQNQAGFRKKHSTTDNIFVLHMLSEYCKHKKSKLFCAFIDFRKAFDSVWRAGLWSKLMKYNVNGRLFNVIKNMYNGIKSCLLLNNKTTDYFYCNQGVRQGENSSPVLFSLFLNDLEHFMLSHNNSSLNINELDLDVYLKIVVLLYADDTVLFAKNEHEFISLMDTFVNYCKTWKLDINVDKTKVLVFGDRPGRHRNIIIQNHTFEVVDTFKYLGVLFSKNRRFVKAKKHVVEQARKALFSLYFKIRNLCLSLDCQLKLFDNTVVPILLYASEVWGYGDLNMIEKIHTDFMKHILNVKRSTPHVMLYGDLGRFPLSITVKKRMISFWYKLTENGFNLSSILYKVFLNDSIRNNNVYGWLQHVKTILDECGLSYVWYNQTFAGSSSALANLVENSLKAQYLQTWSSNVNESAKCYNYIIYKTEHKFE